MRAFTAIVGVAACAATLGACAAISGLGSYSNGSCGDGCDASTDHVDAGKPPVADATTDGAMMSQPDATGPASEAGGDEGGEDAPAESGCSTGLISCSGACVDPAGASNCGACGVVCDGDASLCASMDAGFACASTCPVGTTMCGSSCVDTMTNVTNCMTCDNACTTSVGNASPTCSAGVCGFACNEGFTFCGNACVDLTTSASNCGGCGATFACAAGSTCSESVCQAAAEAGADTGTGMEAGVAHDAGTDGGSPPHDAGGDGAIPCPSGGCPSSTATGFVCALGGCNGAAGACTAASQGCYCTTDTQCLSQKCVKVSGNNDTSCTTCTGSGAHDGFNCELASPGIPPISGGSYSCPANSGFGTTTLTCNAAHTACYCTNDNQCPSGKCIQNSANNNNCSGLGPCTGTGTPDYRGCQAPSGPSTGSCATVCSVGQCTAFYNGTCNCDNDDQCESGKCTSSCGSKCTGTGTAQSNNCVAPPASIACTGTGTYSCTTTASPAPVPNAGDTQCLCTGDGDCSSGQCVNANTQCTGTCSGSGTADSQDCKVITSTVSAWSCTAGNCNNVTSSSGRCTAAGVPCWCTADSQCPSGDVCATWAGCSGTCSGAAGAAGGNAFNCVP